MLFLISAAILLLACAFYLHYIAPLNYFRKIQMPHPKPTWIFGNVLDDWNHGAHTNQLENIKKFGKMYGTFFGTVPIIWVSDPEMIKSITVKHFDHFINRHEDIPLTIDSLRKGLVLLRDGDWKRVRNILSPTFTTAKLKQALSIIRDTSGEFASNLVRLFHMQEQTVNISRMYSNAVMKSVLANSFGVTSNGKDDELAGAAHTIFENQGIAKILASISPYITAYFAKLIPGTFHAFKVLDRTVKQVIQVRKTQNTSPNDILNLMLEANDKGALSDVEIAAQSTTILIGGYESTRNTLVFATYLLATHPAIQDKLIEEIDSNVPNEESTLAYETIIKLPYLDMVISEVLRLYPAIYEISRDTNDDITIQGYHFNKNQAIKIPVYGLHHNPDLWPDPEQFIPERFTAEAKMQRHQYSYLPFGLGLRSCIGMRLALFTIKSFLVETLRNIKFERCNKTTVPLKVAAAASLKPADDIYIRIIKRK